MGEHKFLFLPQHFAACTLWGMEKIKPAKNVAGSQRAPGISLTWRLLNSHLKWCRTWWARITLDIVHWTVHYKRLCFIMFSFYPFDKKKVVQWVWTEDDEIDVKAEDFYVKFCRLLEGAVLFALRAYCFKIEKKLLFIIFFRGIFCGEML